MNTIRLKDAKIYMDTKYGSYKINATYIIENEKEIVEQTIKGISLYPILPMHNLPSVECELSDGLLVDKKITNIDYLPVSDIEYKVIETKTKEMTIEEIEKALGHKIKIVGGDK